MSLLPASYADLSVSTSIRPLWLCLTRRLSHLQRKPGMLDSDTLPRIRQAIQARTLEDSLLLDQLRQEVLPLHSATRRIAPRSTTSISLVASDGGNNTLTFDPFLIQLVRVVDSYGRELCLDAVTPTTDTDRLSDWQFTEQTALGFMMERLGVQKLYQLSTMIPRPARADDSAVRPSWVLVYRDLCEWAVLFERIVRAEFGTDTLIVRDGLLRSKLFANDLFIQMVNQLNVAIAEKARIQKRKLYLVGFAKHSKVLTRYRLAMALEGILQEAYPAYVAIPRVMEANSYLWQEYAPRDASEHRTEAPKFVAGRMFFAKFGNRPRDPVWAIDILDAQTADAAMIFGYLLADALDGFPVPLYPRCLQKAHEQAALVGFDMDILQEEIFLAVRSAINPQQHYVLDAFRFGSDPSNARYE